MRNLMEYVCASERGKSVRQSAHAVFGSGYNLENIFPPRVPICRTTLASVRDEGEFLIKNITSPYACAFAASVAYVATKSVAKCRIPKFGIRNTRPEKRGRKYTSRSWHFVRNRASVVSMHNCKSVIACIIRFADASRPPLCMPSRRPIFYVDNEYKSTLWIARVSEPLFSGSEI